MKKKMILALVVVIILIGIIAYLTIKEANIFNKILLISKQDEEIDLSINKFEISDNENNSVNLIFTRENGISKIQYPTGFELYCNKKKKVSIDFEVEENKNYTFKIIDSIGNETYETFSTPTANIQLTKGDLNITLDDVVRDIRKELNNRNIATNFIKMAIGDNETKDTTTTNVSTIFSNWKSFGDGNWGYSKSNNWIYNTKNSDYMTGYYEPDGNYENIELEFEARTTDSDDDLIGCIIRFNPLENNKCSTYLYLLDRHDSNGGWGNGAYNGISKIVNNLYVNNSTFQTLSVNPNNRWIRNTWQKYRFVAKGSNITAYLDGKQIATTTDNSISSGTIGFVSYSQAYTYYRNITIITTRLRTLGEIINKIDWNSKQNNIIINISNESDSDLSENEVIEIMNSNNIYYFALGNQTNKEEVEQFLQNINDRGKYLNSNNIEESIISIAEYLKDVLIIK